MAAELVFALLDAKPDLLPAHGALWVLFHLCNRANEKKGYYCCPGTKTIAEDVKRSERHVITKLDELEADGWLRRVRNGYFFRYELAVARILALESKHPTKLLTEQSSVSSDGLTELPANPTELSAEPTELCADLTEKRRTPLKEGNSLETSLKPLLKPSKSPSTGREMASEIIGSLGLVGHYLEKDLPKVCEVAIRSYPDLSPEILTAFMADQYGKYLAAVGSGKLTERTFDAQQFYNGKHWESHKTWNWRSESRPFRMSTTVRDANGEFRVIPPPTDMQLFLRERQKAERAETKPVASEYDPLPASVKTLEEAMRR